MRCIPQTVHAADITKDNGLRCLQHPLSEVLRAAAATPHADVHLQPACSESYANHLGTLTFVSSAVSQSEGQAILTPSIHACSSAKLMSINAWEEQRTTFTACCIVQPITDRERSSLMLRPLLYTGYQCIGLQPSG